MPNPLNNSGIRDNHRRGFVADFWRANLRCSSSSILATRPYSKQRDAAADASALEREIDEWVYARYGLTPEVIKIVEGAAE